MPDEKKKQPSGNDKRVARLKREEQERREESVRRAKEGAEPAEHVKQFMRAGPPPIGDPLAGVRWANDVAMLMLDAVLSDPEFTFEKRLRYASDFIAKLGMLHARAHMQKRLADLEEAAEDEEGDHGLEANPLAGADS